MFGLTRTVGIPSSFRGLDGLTARVVKLAGFADLERATAEDEDFRAVCRSSYQSPRTIEEQLGIDRPGRGLGMKLHAHEGTRAVTDAFVGAVVGVDKPRFPARRQRPLIDRIAMVL